ncbi:MAG: hypothetical protein WDM80_17670 [Limisphaerales bacterium]
MRATDRLTVKLYREEVTPHLDLILDGSRSMNLDGTAKASAVAKLSALLATAAANSAMHPGRLALPAKVFNGSPMTRSRPLRGTGWNLTANVRLTSRLIFCHRSSAVLACAC